MTFVTICDCHRVTRATEPHKVDLDAAVSASRSTLWGANRVCLVTLIKTDQNSVTKSMQGKVRFLEQWLLAQIPQMFQ